MKRLIKISIIVYYFMITASFGADKIVASSINGKLLNPLKVHSDYSFLLAGHIYGSHNKSIFPAASLLANIELLNDLKPDFMVLLGDIVSGCNELEFAKLRESFLTKVTFPVFNAVGNHDVPNDDLRVLYEKHFGKTFFSFEVGSELFIFLDSERHNGQIKSDQFDFLKKNIDKLKGNDPLKSAFIFSHRLLWAIGNPPFNKIIPYVNGPGYHPLDATTITNLLQELKSTINKKIFFVSGDIGTWWSLPLFFSDDLSKNITYIATGIGDTQKDAIIKVGINKGKITFTPISLTGQTIGPLENYNLSYWEDYFNKKHYKDHLMTNTGQLVKSYLKKIFMMIKHKYFWSGAILSLLISLAVFVFISNLKK